MITWSTSYTSSILLLKTVRNLALTAVLACFKWMFAVHTSFRIDFETSIDSALFSNRVHLERWFAVSTLSFLINASWFFQLAYFIGVYEVFIFTFIATSMFAVRNTVFVLFYASSLEINVVFDALYTFSFLIVFNTFGISSDTASINLGISLLTLFAFSVPNFFAEGNFTNITRYFKGRSALLASVIIVFLASFDEALFFFFIESERFSALNANSFLIDTSWLFSNTLEV